MVKSVSPSDRLVENSVEKVPIAVRLVASRSDESARAAEPEEATAFTESRKNLSTESESRVSFWVFFCGDWFLPVHG